jgi:hypothetical protein
LHLLVHPGGSPDLLIDRDPRPRPATSTATSRPRHATATRDRDRDCDRDRDRDRDRDQSTQSTATVDRRLRASVPPPQAISGRPVYVQRKGFASIRLK